MNEIQSYRDLKVWQMGIAIAKESYKLTKTFPREELFAITNQIRRAATSVPANIAEGYGRDSRGEYMQFLRYAQGSLKELETHFIISEEVGIIPKGHANAVLQLCDEQGRMLRTLIRSLREWEQPVADRQ